MKISFATSVIFCFMLILSVPSFSQQVDSTDGYIIRHESDLLKAMKSPNNGKGSILGGTFFDDSQGYTLSLRKRILQNGSSLGKHIQKNDEIYYVIRGEGTAILNDTPIHVKSGDAVLTRKGSSHELEQTSKEDLEILVIFRRQ